MDWRECNQKRIIKEVSIDLDLIESLKKTSENKLISGEKLELSEITSSSKIILVYDSLREILEALALGNKFKIYNHECYVAFLKEILNKSEIGEEFNELRKIRNDINYYGKEIDVINAKWIINRIKNLRREVFILLNN
jgi:hypothetical protein